ncbi:hypothetical protein E4U26_006025, partial [Claviceps purpurea]
MPVDYSKWDALELSDDSDIEVHPNVDKRSFIRAKQNQIHQERQQRKLQIELYKFENIIHDGLLKRISSMTAFLRQHGPQASEAPDIALRALLETNPGPAADAVPARPEGLQSEHPTPTTFSQMMATLIDEINKSLDSRDDTEKKPRYQGLIEGFEEHAKKITDIKKETTSKLEALLKEEGKKITSSDIHTGFDSSHVTKASPLDKKGAGTEVELLNPSFNAQSSSTKAAEDDDDEEIEASDAAKQFAKIPPRDYAASLKFLSQNPHILTEKETDGLLVLAFDAALERNDDYSHQCVHQALLLQYCRALGKDGVALFFKRITTKGHQAQEIFFKDVQDTYMRIKNRSREILAERARDPDGATQDVEQIQLHAVDPGTVIQIKVPAADSQDEEEKQAREIFEGFSPEMRTALESGDLDAVNKVLGKMKVEDAEELVAMFDKANILSMEEQIIDATTEDGLKQLHAAQHSQTLKFERRALSAVARNEAASGGATSWTPVGPRSGSPQIVPNFKPIVTWFSDKKDTMLFLRNIVGLAAVAGGAAGHAFPQAQVPEASSATSSSSAAASSTSSPTASTGKACNNSPSLCNRPYNNITHMGAHNSPFLRDQSTGDSLSGNQFLNATRALDAGLRLLQAQVHKPNSTLELCHTSCSLLDAGALETWLSSIHTWLTQNPNEVITLLLVNADKAPASEFGPLFDSAGLSDLAYKPATANELSASWPTLQAMIAANTRLVSFVTNIQYSASTPYLLPEFTHVFETPFEVASIDGFNCTIDRPSRASKEPASSALASGYLSLVNHFKYQSVLAGVEIPDVSSIETVNSAGGSVVGNLGKHLGECRGEWNRVPNFVLVDFWNRGDVIAAVDGMNG